jgi:hypothetical protein
LKTGLANPRDEIDEVIIGAFLLTRPSRTTDGLVWLGVKAIDADANLL